MIIRKKDKFLRLIGISSIAGVMTLFPILKTLAEEMPTGASIESGSITITGTNTNMVIDQSTDKSVINGRAFNS